MEGTVGTRQRSASAQLRMRNPRSRFILDRGAVVLVILLVILLAVLSALGARSTAQTPRYVPLSAAAPASAVHDTTDLDADGTDEAVWRGTGRGGIRIVDGSTSYESRDKWWVVASALGDSDRDGSPEVVALVDGQDGRHLVLFSWHAGRYQERLASSPLHPAPHSLRVRRDPASGGDVIDLVEISRSAGTTRITTYRWNGFGFIALNGRSAP